MIIVDVKEGDSIDKALRKYKRKHFQIGVMKELQKRKQFTKPSVERRNEIQNTLYKLKKYGED